MRRVLFVNRSYWPDVEATGQLLTELCEDLAREFDVSVVCGQPNQNPERVPYRRIGKEVRNGVTVRRVPHTRFSKLARRRWRALNMLSFVISATFAAFFCRRPDVIVVETDPPLLCLLGHLVKCLRRCELIVYLQDIYPDVAAAMHQLPRWFPVSLVRRLFHFVYRKADRVVVLSHDMERFLVESGVPEQKVTVIPNWVDTMEIHPVRVNNQFRKRHSLGDQFVVMYSGNMGLSQRLDVVLQAAHGLRDCHEILFLLVGDGANRKLLEASANEMNLQNVRFLDYQPKRDLALSLSAADVHLVLLDPPLTKYLMPSKFCSALAVGSFVVAITDPSCELARIVDEEDVGAVVRPDDIEALKAVICGCSKRTELVEVVGRRARQLAVDRYDRRVAVEAFGRLLERDSASSYQKCDIPHPRKTVSVFNSVK